MDDDIARLRGVHRCASILIAGLLASVLIAAPASAATSSPPRPGAGAPLVGNGIVVDIPIGPPDAVHPSEAVPFYWGDDTDEFVIETARPSNGRPVLCEHAHGFGTVDEIRIGAESWDAGRVVVPIDNSGMRPWWSGSRYDFSCSAGDGSWSLDWPLETVGSAGASVTLRDDADLSAVTRFSTEEVVPQAVHVGDTVRLVGVPGTWPLASGATRTAVEILVANGGWLDEAARIGDHRISPDGSALSFVVTRDVLGLDLGLPVRLQVVLSAEYASAGIRTTTYASRIAVSEAAASTTTLRIAHPVGLSFLQTRVTAVIASTAGAAPNGVVTFVVDGERVAAVALTDAAAGRATVSLPFLPRGRHVVTAFYGGSPSISPSISSGGALRILF